jgi:hypothetical protein
MTLLYTLINFYENLFYSILLFSSWEEKENTLLLPGFYHVPKKYRQNINNTIAVEYIALTFFLTFTNPF